MIHKDAIEWHREARSRGYESASEWLTQLYHSGNKSIAEVAKEAGLSKSGAYRLLQQFGVEMRSRGGPNRMGR